MGGPLLPDDDLYARLEVTPDASSEAVELAWRALLKRHHPDIAGDLGGLERTKRINVAHDWLSDPLLRERYDQARLGRRRGPARRASPPAPAQPRPTRRPRASRDRVLDAEPALRIPRFLDRVARLTSDELDRLSLAEPPPIAFLATLRRFGPVDGERRLAEIETELQRRLPADRWADLAIRGALLGVAAELVWGAFLDEHLAGAFRVRARERLLRGWEAAVDRSRYGPNAAVVDPFLDRVRSLSSEEAAAIVRAARGVPASERPWPDGFDPAENDGLRVSAALAARDAAAALGPELVRPAVTARLRRVLGRVAHAIALRHLFEGRQYADLVAPWTAAIGEGPPGEVRRPRPRVRRAGA